jgi:hypothetical protein
MYHWNNWTGIACLTSKFQDICYSLYGMYRFVILNVGAPLAVEQNEVGYVL